MNYVDATRRVWDALDDDSTPHQRYTTANILDYLDKASNLYLVRTESYHKTVTITQQPEVAMYALPADCVRVTRVLWVNSSENNQVIPTTMREMDDWHGIGDSWESDHGTRATHYYLFGVNSIGLYPMISSSTQSYTVHYIAEETGDMPSSFNLVPDEDHEAIVSYAVARCLATDNKVEAALEEYKKFQTRVNRARVRRSNPDRTWAVSSRMYLGAS